MTIRELSLRQRWFEIAVIIDARRRNVVIDISGVEHLDTMGAWLLERLGAAISFRI